MRVAGALAEAGVREVCVNDGAGHPPLRLFARSTDLPRELFALPPGSEVVAMDRSIVVKITLEGPVVERPGG